DVAEAEDGEEVDLEPAAGLDALRRVLRAADPPDRHRRQKLLNGAIRHNKPARVSRFAPRETEALLNDLPLPGVPLRVVLEGGVRLDRPLDHRPVVRLVPEDVRLVGDVLRRAGEPLREVLERTRDEPGREAGDVLRGGGEAERAVGADLGEVVAEAAGEPAGLGVVEDRPVRKVVVYIRQRTALKAVEREEAGEREAAVDRLLVGDPEAVREVEAGRRTAAGAGEEAPRGVLRVD